MDLYSLNNSEILDRISRHCPEALSTYLQCRYTAKKGSVYFSRKVIDIDMSQDFRAFRNNIKKLARENLLEWHPLDDGISITLADFDDNE